jgi:serine/threonine protein kinase
MSPVGADKIGPYEILELLHSDDRGRVYRARDTRLGRIVAIKVLPVSLSQNGESLEKVERRARAISSLDHPNICRLYDVGCQDGLDYLVMEYLEGESLAERLTKGPLELVELLRSAVEICSGLEAAHEHCIFHRDLSTGAVMLTGSGAKLLDFGLGHLVRGLTRAHAQIVAPFHHYAPEQYLGKPVDACCNVFSFGIMFYEMATGAFPFPAETLTSFILAVIREDPLPPASLNPQLPAGLDEIIFKCLEKERPRRYQSAGEILYDLQGIIERLKASAGEEVSAALLSLATRSKRRALAGADQRSTGTWAGLARKSSARPSTRGREGWEQRMFKALMRVSSKIGKGKKSLAPGEPTLLRTGTKLGPYQIHSLLGAGGMGEVYRAHDSRISRDVAIKVLRSLALQDSLARERFQREARAVASLNHPHICQLYDVGYQGGIDYLVMECLKGETLASRLKRGPLGAKEVVLYGIQLADALEQAHQRGIIHRDVKPANIFLLLNQQCKVLDFGLAKVPAGIPADAQTTTSPAAVTAWGAAIGTAHYMSPEQARGERIDHRSDIFSMGATLYEMATGKLAFGGKTLALVFQAILAEAVPSMRQVVPSLPSQLDAIVSKALQKDRNHRYQSAGELREALRQASHDLAA